MLAYREDLEKQLIKTSQRYFTGKAAEWIAVDSVPDYLRKAEAALAAESERVHVSSRTCGARRLLFRRCGVGGRGSGGGAPA
jgi:hypothetical protein